MGRSADNFVTTRSAQARFWIERNSYSWNILWPAFGWNCLVNTVLFGKANLIAQPAILKSFNTTLQRHLLEVKYTLKER